MMKLQIFSTTNRTQRFPSKCHSMWSLDYVSQIVNLHEELIIPKSHTPLSTVSSFTGKLKWYGNPK